MPTIILTDYPKMKHIDANLRGVSTERLLALDRKLSHTMMLSHDEECGGYIICFDYKAIKEELRFRGVDCPT